MEISGLQPGEDVKAGCTRLVDARAEYYIEHLLRRGKAWAHKGDIDRAIADFSEVISPGSQHTRAYVARGRLWALKGEFDRALADFDGAVELGITLGPVESSVYVDRGQVHFYKGDFALAVADFERANNLAARADTLLWRHIARGHLHQDDSPELAIDAARLVAKDWPFAVIAFYRGERSADDMLAAASNEQERCEARFYLGEWHLLRERSSDAATAFRDVARTCPRDIAAYLGALAELKRQNP